MTKDEKDSIQEFMKEKLLEKQEEAKIIRKWVFRISIVLAALFIAVSLGSGIYVYTALKPADPDSDKTVSVEIPMGSTAADIARILEDKGIIKNATVFKYYVKFKNESGFMAGKYELSPSMTFPEITSMLKTGKVVREAVMKITIPEGKKLTEIAHIISKKTPFTEEEVLGKLTDDKYIKELNAAIPRYFNG